MILIGAVLFVCGVVVGLTVAHSLVTRANRRADVIWRLVGKPSAQNEPLALLRAA
jgi:hypothetical protein